MDTVPVNNHPAPAALSSVSRLPALSARSAYTTGLGVFAAVFGPLLVCALADLSALLGGPDWGRGWNGHALALTTTGIVLLHTAHGWRWWLPLPFALTLTGAALAHTTTPTADTAVTVAWALSGTALTLRLLTSRGITPRMLGLTPPATTRGGGARALHVAALAVAGMAASAITTALVNTALPWLPTGAPRQAGLPNPVDLAAHIAVSGLIEETVFAGLAAALQAARRPAWQVYTLTALARTAIHAYYGPAALTTVIMATVNLWAWRRHRRLTPLIIAHTLYNTLAVYGGPGAVLLLTALAAGALTLG